MSDPLESEVKARVVGFYRKAGCFVVDLDQGYRPGGKRHGTTRQTKGIGDLVVLPPPGLPMFWHELKREGGEQRWEQQLFQSECERRGVRYVIGGYFEAVDVAIALGFWRLPAGVRLEMVAAPWTLKRETEAAYLKRMARRRRAA